LAEEAPYICLSCAQPFESPNELEIEAGTGYYGKFCPHCGSDDILEQ
jgi:DNA-directed RNA polymerase subunit RPC12/RpoP